MKMQNICYICQEKFEFKNAKDNKYCKWEIIFIMQWNIEANIQANMLHTAYNLKYSIPKEITIIFHNRSNHDYHFITKEIAEDLKESLFV